MIKQIQHTEKKHFVSKESNAESSKRRQSNSTRAWPMWRSKSEVRLAAESAPERCSKRTSQPTATQEVKALERNCN